MRTLKILLAALGSLGMWSLALQATFAQDRVLLQFPVNKKTAFFEHYFMRNSPLVEEIPRFADAFVQLVNQEFFKADYDYPIKVMVLEDHAKFQDFLRRHFGVENPPNFGIFFGELKCFVTHESAGLGTFAHEILHPLVERNLPLHPVWATEGIPSFFEKFYGYWDGDKLVAQFGYQNPWRIQAIGADLMTLDLGQILAYKDTQGRFRESEQRMVSMFMWKHGKFKKMLQQIQTGVPIEGYQTWFEAAMEMKLQELEPLWRAYLKEVAAAHHLFALPPSTILADEPSYRLFAARHNLLSRIE